MLFCLAHVCNTAVRKPVGKVKADNQNMIGWCAVVAHLSNWSTLCTRSRVQAARGLLDGYALCKNIDKRNEYIHNNIVNQ